MDNAIGYTSRQYLKIILKLGIHEKGYIHMSFKLTEIKGNKNI